MAKIIQTSFKQTEDALFMEVSKYSDKSSFIKFCINFYLTSNEKPRQEKNSHFSNNNEVVDILKNL